MPDQSSEKTEQATPKRKRDTREKGQVSKSVEFTTVLMIMSLFGSLSIFGARFIENTRMFLTNFLSFDASDVYGISNSDVTKLFSDIVLNFFNIMSPIFIAAVVAALIANYLQVGFLFSPKAIQPKMDKINMISGFKKLFSMKTLIEAVKSIIKIAIIVYIAYTEYKVRLLEFPNLMTNDVFASMRFMTKALLSMAFKVAIAMAVLAPLDYLFQRWKHNKDMKMTKQEVKDESKMTEGDPQIKGKIKQKQREISAMRMMQAIPDADVVITNPTHYAIAISYDSEKHEAPIIIAKGKDHLAIRIKEKAKELDIIMVENRPVAQAMYFHCEVGDEVPQDLYQAVAEILTYVYRLKNKI